MSRHRQAQWSNVTVERTVEWEKDSETNLAVLLVPRFRRGPLKKWLQPRLKKPFIRVKLDAIGDFVWDMCDGKATVEDISKALEEKFGERVKPASERTQFFLNTLYKSNFIRYWQVS